MAKRTDPEIRFWKTVDKSGECWTWNGKIAKTGYGKFFLDDMYKYAHRMSWEYSFGCIPDGLKVCHHCDNRPCVRPDHLFLGTDADNHADGGRKGRYGKKFTPEQVLEIRQRFSNGEKQTAIASKFGVHYRAIYRIVNKLAWKHY